MKRGDRDADNSASLRGVSRRHRYNYKEGHSVSDRSGEGVGGSVSRVRVLKTIATAILGGVLGIFARSSDGEAATRRVLWAVVNADGTRKRGKGVTASNKVSTGDYEIRFERNVDKCAYSVTMDHNSGFAFISLLDPGTLARIVGVTTIDRAGVVRDTPFHLVVNC